LKAWFENHFQDATHARETIAFGCMVGAGVAAIFLVIGTIRAF